MEQEVPGVWPGGQLGYHKGKGCGSGAPARVRERGLGWGGLQRALEGGNLILWVVEGFFLWLLKIKIPLFIYLKIFVGEEHLLCGDQRNCDKESEAGEMCAGAFSSFIFFYYYLCSSCFNDITYCIANKDYSK